MSRVRRGTIGVVAVSAALSLLALAPTAGAAKHPRCTITGTARADNLRGTPKRDVICGRGGRDKIRARAGDDVVLAGGGDDVVLAGEGDDRVDGAQDSDLLRGGAGEDQVDGGPSADKLYGEPNDDQITGGGGHDLCDGGPGFDYCDGFPDDRRDCSRQLQPDDSAFAICAIQGPWLTSVDVHPGFLYVGEAPGAIELEILVADPSTPSPYYGPRPTTVDAEFSSGAGGTMSAALVCDGHKWEYWSCTGSISVPQATPSQTLTLTKVVVHDDSGHYTEYAGPDVCLYGMHPLPSCQPATVDILGEVDHQPPVLESLTVTPGSIDTDEGGADVVVRAEISDAPAGLENAMLLWLGWPGCSCYRGDWQMRSEGDRYHSVFTTTLHLARYSKIGRYPIGVEISDRVGNRLSLRGQDLRDAGFPDRFEQTGTEEDITPPELADFDLEPRVANASNGGVVTATVHVRDDLSGLRVSPQSPFGDAIHILVRHRDGSGYLSTYDATRVAGTDTDGVWKLPLQVPTGAPYEWEVEVTIWDGAGNYVEMDRAQLEAAGFPATFSSE